MTPLAAEDWDCIRALFDAALALPAGQRAEHVRNSGLPEALQAEVLSLLAHSSGGAAAETGFMAGSPDGAARLATPRLGERLGAWELVALLGSGGMGEVFLARRADGAYQGEAAVKLLRQGMDSAAVLQRFALERQALARLAHPHIAHLLDAGLSATGQPFFVMERVHGQPIDAACQGQPLAKVLAIFLQLTDAVSHAHRNLLVHRDLKPGNVMVDGQGQVKLLDFGIAKALSSVAEDGPDAQDLTLLAQRPFTPSFASPEQVRGEPVSTATDVYSLGVLLYLLLTGQRPYGRGATDPVATARAVLEEAPTRPSNLPLARAAVGPPPASRKQLRGDLDNIVLKALEKEPARRYASVEALAADLRAYLDGYPVSARAPSWRYLAARFVGRHRIGVALGGLALLALMTSLGSTLWQARQAELARAQAVQRFAQLRKLSKQLVFSYHDQIAQLPGSLKVRSALLSDAISYMDSLSQSLDTALGSDPALARDLAESYSRIAALQGDGFSPSEEQLQAALVNIDKALALQSRYLEQDRRDAPALRVAGEMWQGRAILETRLGRLQAAVDALEQARQLSERATALAPDDLENLSNLATVTGRIAQLQGGSSTQAQLGRLSAAGQSWREAQRLFQRMVDAEPGNPEWLHQLAWSYQGLSNWAQLVGQAVPAAAHAERMLQLRDASAALAPDNANYRYQRAMARSIAGTALAGAGRSGEALALMDEGIALLAVEQQRDQANLSAARDLVLLRFGRARLLWQTHGDAAARRALEQSLAAFPPGSSLAEDFYMARWRCEALLWNARAATQPETRLSLSRQCEALMLSTHNSPENANRRWMLAQSRGEQAAALAALGRADAPAMAAQALQQWRAGPEAAPDLFRPWIERDATLAQVAERRRASRAQLAGKSG